MELLGWWLMLVGTLRLASVWFGFVDIWALRLAVFSKTTILPDGLDNVHANWSGHHLHSLSRTHTI
ncbi:hypothetical protein KY290_022486 [Solanum tuberosum]|uniref:Secreted protein n=1 Tax=Solanum tuberosum TaxID=4113 RepID=A0ABQ7V6K0_SOLTU|nr:hypothetical protein KY284_021386 [Solanum tuberosum]KAH0758993.1 hypothetical protein KY290_022486 [Solanum tuberosum]